MASADHLANERGSLHSKGKSHGDSGRGWSLCRSAVEMMRSGGNQFLSIVSKNSYVQPLVYQSCSLKESKSGRRR
eukprot:364669-Chlamydomonas_euryale.AAC.2